jgi:hypothetical protein
MHDTLSGQIKGYSIGEIMQRKISLTIGLVLLAAMAACAKKPFTVISDTSLIQNPGEKQVVKVPGGEMRRGEVVQLLEEKKGLWWKEVLPGTD